MSLLSAVANGFSRIGINFGSRNQPKNMSLLHDVDVPTKKATFAMACFWAPDALFGATPGVIRTRVGYAGGTKEGPTYRSLGDHTEAIDVDFDPSAITFAKLLDIFWLNHDPTARTTKQYTSLIFYHDDEQKKLAEETLKEQEGKHKSPIVTQILPAGTFWDAEDYHQKYRLQQHDWLMRAIGMKCDSKLKTSHLAARLNGYVIGRGGVAQFERDVARLGLSEEVADFVRKLCVKYENAGPFC